jgi:glycosyltransferase involved in cell wall biosynthesis
VVSKGIIDLLSAIKLILASKPKQKIKLDIISNIKFCSVDFLQKINNIINELKTDFPTLSDINLHYNINDSEKNLILSAADLFVLPTYHEGFCVPILEAFASGCIVVVYDIEGIKMTAGHLAIKVPLGNTNILTEILVEQLNIVSSSSWQKNYSEYCQNCLEHLKQFSTDKIKKLFLLSIT